MARRPARETVTKPIDPNLPERDRIIAALMGLLAERRFEAIGFNDIAARAGVSLVAIDAAHPPAPRDPAIPRLIVAQCFPIMGLT